MNSKKRERVNKLKKELAWLDPKQEMVHSEDDQFFPKPETFKESLSRGFRSIIAIILCLVIPALWYFDWDTSSFANSTSETVTDLFETGSAPALPSPSGIAPLPPSPDVEALTLFDGSMIDYTSALKEAGLLELFSSPAIRTFYENGVTIEYLTRLKEAGMIESFSFPAITAFFQNQISLDFLSELNSENLIENLSFPAVIALHQNDVSIDYLRQFDEAGYLETLSFPAIVTYYQNGVNVEFLDELKNRKLLEDLSFPAVVDLFNNR